MFLWSKLNFFVFFFIKQNLKRIFLHFFVTKNNFQKFERNDQIDIESLIVFNILSIFFINVIYDFCISKLTKFWIVLLKFYSFFVIYRTICFKISFFFCEFNFCDDDMSDFDSKFYFIHFLNFVIFVVDLSHKIDFETELWN